MSMEELLALPVSIDLETAGRAFGLGRTKSHELARADDFPCPVKRFGNRYRVLRADLLAAVGLDPVLAARQPAAEPAADSAVRMPTGPMGVEELLALPVIFGIKTAARALGIGQNRAYEMAAAGTFPCHVQRDGREYKVTRFDLFDAMSLDPVLPPRQPTLAGGGTPEPATGQRDGFSGEAAYALYEALMAAARVLVDRERT